VLIVRDVSGNLDQIEELVRSLDTQTPQVLVEARIVEATSRYLRDIGIQWGGDATFSPATGNPTGVAFPSSVGVAGGATDNQTPTAGLSPFDRTVANPNFAVNLPAAVGTGAGGALGLTLGSINNTVNLGIRLSAAESTGMIRIISSPRILTMGGAPGGNLILDGIISGGEFRLGTGTHTITATGSLSSTNLTQVLSGSISIASLFVSTRRRRRLRTASGIATKSAWTSP